MSKPEIAKERRDGVVSDLMKELEKNIVVYELHESYYQMKELSNNKNSDDLQIIANIQKELKKNRAMLEFIQLTTKNK